MQLRSPDGALVDLRIAGYQFPYPEAGVQVLEPDRLQEAAKAGPAPNGEGAGDEDDLLDDDPDGDWLQVRGHITLADGKTGAFEDPCLQIEEARGLGRWLRQVAAGTVLPSPGAGREHEGLLYFTEPAIAFSVAERTADRVRIRVHFSAESLPPWLRNTPVKPRLFEYFVRLEVTAEELTRVAESWALELAEFPKR
jgi:hypothetical protein